MATARELFFGQVHHLTGQRWNNDAKGLGKNHQIQHQARLEPQGHGRFRLAPAHRLYARADDFGNECGRIENQSEQQRRKLGADVDSPLEIESRQRGGIHGGRGAAEQPCQQGEPEQQADGCPENGKRHPGFRLPFSGPFAHEKTDHTAGNQRNGHVSMDGIGLGDGKDKAAIAQKNAGKGTDGLSGARQNIIEKSVPEKKLKQNRYILEDFDVNGGDPRDEPIGRKPGDTDQGPEEHGEHDPDKRDDQRVEGADHQGPAIAVRR